MHAFFQQELDTHKPVEFKGHVLTMNDFVARCEYRDEKPRIETHITLFPRESQ